MKFELTNPKAWKAVSERNIPMSHKIKVYEKLGGAYRMGEDGGEQVYNNIAELLKSKLNEGDGSDHEVGMALNLLDDVIKNATELKGKIGTEETNLAGWIQDHISQAQNFINQANTGFHKLDNSELSELKKLPSGNFSIKVGYPTFADYEKKAKVGDTILRYDKRGSMIKTFVDGSELNKKAEKYLDKVNNITGGVVYLSKKGMSGVAQVPDYEKKDIGVLVLESKSINEEFKYIIKVDSPREVLSKRVAAEVEKLAKSGARSKEIGLQMGFVGNNDKTVDSFQVLKNKIYFSLDKRESINEGASKAELDKVRQAVEAASSFMNVGSELKKLGIRYVFATEPLPIYIVQQTPNNRIAIVNKRYATKPDFVVGDIAVGVMD